jgi:hypothetical protein
LACCPAGCSNAAGYSSGKVRGSAAQRSSHETATASVKKALWLLARYRLHLSQDGTAQDEVIASWRVPSRTSAGCSNEPPLVRQPTIVGNYRVFNEH